MPVRRAVAYLAAAVTASLYFVAATMFSSGADWVLRAPQTDTGAAVLAAAASGAAWAFLAYIPAEWFLDRRPERRSKLFWPVAAALASVAAARALSRLAEPTSSLVSLWLAAVPDGARVFFAFLLFDFSTGWYESLMRSTSHRD